MPGDWHEMSDGSGYTLEMTAEAKTRRIRWWLLANRERQKAFKEWELASLKQMRARFNEKGDFGSGPQVGGFKNSPQSTQRFFNLLPENLQSSVAQNFDRSVFDDLGQAVINTRSTESGVLCELATLPESTRSVVIPFLYQRDTNGYLNIINAGFRILVNVVNVRGETLGTVFGLDVSRQTPDFSQRDLARLNHFRLPDAVQRLSEKAPKSWQELALYQRSTIWTNPPPTIPSGNQTVTIRRVAALDSIHKESSQDYIADYYTDRPVRYVFSRGTGPVNKGPEKFPSRQQFLDNERNCLSADYDSSWKNTKSNILLVKNNRWYRDDALEVPLDLLDKWKAIKAKWHKEASRQKPAGKTPANRRDIYPLSGLPPSLLKEKLDYEQEILDSLSSLQLRNGFVNAIPEERPDDYSGPPTSVLSDGTISSAGRRVFLNDAQQMIASLSLRRFYRTLSDEQKTELIQGKLDFYTLSPEQKLQVLPLLSASQKKYSNSDQRENASDLFLGLSDNIRRLVSSNQPIDRTPALEPVNALSPAPLPPP